MEKIGSLFETSRQACGRLSISQQTLYAYVSRGLIRTELHAEDSRRRLYRSADIDQLEHRQQRGRSRRAVAHSTIDFGEPVLRSRVSSISDGHFYYRSVNAVELSRTASLEDIFELLCETKIDRSHSLVGDDLISKRRTPLARFIEALAQQVGDGRRKGDKRHAYKLLQIIVSNAARGSRLSNKEEFHQQLARCWSDDPRAPDLIRRALVLSADHELNASSYATRVTASAGSSLSACLLTGVSTLSGDLHGGLSNLCVAWMKDSASRKIGEIEMNTNQPPPGFGHRLYPNGDPRANEIVSQCAPPMTWQRIAKKVIKKTHAHPTLDYGLAILEHQLKLPKGSAFSIFAVGRTVGWLAHCFEQRKDGRLIRPRASR